MRYTPRDLRAADIFAMILIGFGLVLLVVGLIAFATRLDGTSASVVTKSPEGKVTRKAKPSFPPGVAFAVCGFTLGCLGGALSFKVRQLIGTGGVEPSEYGETAAS
jgi:hypothetical protein